MTMVQCHVQANMAGLAPAADHLHQKQLHHLLKSLYRSMHEQPLVFCLQVLLESFTPQISHVKALHSFAPSPTPPDPGNLAVVPQLSSTKVSMTPWHQTLSKHTGCRMV
jgi:hypothetical protein